MVWRCSEEGSKGRPKKRFVDVVKEGMKVASLREKATEHRPEMEAYESLSLREHEEKKKTSKHMIFLIVFLEFSAANAHGPLILVQFKIT